MYPILFSFGENLVLRSYSVFLAAGYLVAYMVTRKEVARKKMNPDLAETLLFSSFVGGLGGAKALFLYQNATFAQFFAEPARYLLSGFSSAGGLFGILLAAAIVSRMKKVHFQVLLDILCPAIIIGYGIGRIGCFLNGCDYGVACDLPWAVTFSESAVNVHPAQIYDTLFTIVLFAFLWKIRKNDDTPGRLASIGFVILGVQRFLVESFIRETTPSFIEGISQAQIACVALIAVFGWRLWRIYFATPALAKTKK